MIRVVLDTNVVVSALLQPRGPSAQIFLTALSGSIQLCVSGNVYAEYEEVIGRPRLKRSAEIISATLHSIREKAFGSAPIEKVRACLDPDDDIFLECAQACACGLSGDRERQGFSQRLGGYPNCYPEVVARSRITQEVRGNIVAADAYCKAYG